MKEITKTTVKKYDESGKLIEHTETTVEKQIIQDSNVLKYPWQQPNTIPLYPQITYTGDTSNFEYDTITSKYKGV